MAVIGHLRLPLLDHTHVRIVSQGLSLSAVGKGTVLMSLGSANLAGVLCLVGERTTDERCQVADAD